MKELERELESRLTFVDGSYDKPVWSGEQLQVPRAMRGIVIDICRWQPVALRAALDGGLWLPEIVLDLFHADDKARNNAKLDPFGVHTGGRPTGVWMYNIMSAVYDLSFHPVQVEEQWKDVWCSAAALHAAIDDLDPAPEPGSPYARTVKFALQELEAGRVDVHALTRLRQASGRRPSNSSGVHLRLIHPPATHCDGR